MGQIVDTESAKEFMKETLGKISPDELSQICTDLEIKSRKFRQRLARESIDRISEEEFYTILRSIFSTRRKAKQVLENYTNDHLKEWTIELLYGGEEIQDRFQTFCERFDGLENSIRHDFASELLHFTFPDHFWLWTRWMWNEKTQTGALPLVVTEDCDLEAPSFGETYLKIGEAVAFVHHVGEAAGFQTLSRTLFGTDVYLSCVYVVYVYTVLRMRMTQEFNKVVPGLSEFSRRLLGVYKMEDSYAGS